MNGIKPLSRCLALAFGGSALMLALATSAYAQSNATANVFGQIEAGEGALVTVENIETGLKRTITADSSGRYQVSSLPGGTYKVTVSKDGKVTNTREAVQVLVGQGNEISFVARANETIVVTGARQAIDVSNTNSSVTFTAAELSKLPIANNVGAVIQLAPATTRGDSRYGGSNAPSFGGASASENSYYINGFPVTNGLFQVGFAQLPFNSIAQAQILSGGYGAEFGRSTGGVVNITTKSGTNDWIVGGAASLTPNALTAKAKNQYFANNGVARDGKIYFYNESDKSDTSSINLYAGGPIIRDKLFVFASGELTTTKSESINLPSNDPGASKTGWRERTYEVPRYLAKFDWNITDDHRLEFTAIHDEYKDERKFFGFDYTTLKRNDIKSSEIKYVNWGPTEVASQQGADVYIAKYAGNITEALTVNALYGTSKTPHKQIPGGYNPSILQVDATGNGVQAPGINYPSVQTQTGNLLVAGAEDTQEGYRFDIEYKLGKHSLRGGIDYNKIKSKAGTAAAGGGTWLYGFQSDPTVALPGAGSPASGGGLGAQGFFVDKILSDTKSTPSVEQSAQYFEDRFQLNERVLLVAGLRNEQFTNFNGDGVAYIKQTKALAPRLAASWDVNGDSKLKVFGNVGRYHLQIPTNVAIRGAGNSLNTNQYFTYTGVDQATGAPTGLVPIGPVQSANNEFGQPKDPRQVAAINIDAHYQDEFALGFERAFSPKLNTGVKVTYRTLKSTIDDFCDQRPFDAWGARNGVDTSKFAFQCALFNPGKDNDFTIDLNGDGKLENIHLTAADLGYPKVKRTYMALDLFAEHPFSDKWYGKINYTYSRSYGNTEGQLLSDLGQADVSTTQAFDFPELGVGSEGLLPNNRTHQIKAFGFYELTPEWIAGANLLIASGRPKNCLGNLPDPNNPSQVDPNNPASQYGSSFFYCKGIATPRGSQGTLPWDTRFDLNVTYKPSFVKGLQLKLDIFNVFDQQIAQNIFERYNAAGGSSAIRANYNAVVSYTAPRSMKLTALYEYKF